MHTRTALRAAGLFAAAGAATAAYGCLIERNLFTLRRFDVPVLAPDAEPLRVLHISDLHMMPGGHFFIQTAQPALLPVIARRL